LGYGDERSALLEFWKAAQGVRSYSGPEVKIWGWGGVRVEKKKPQPGMAGADVAIDKTI